MSTTFDQVIEFIRNLYGAEGFIPLHAPVFLGNEKKYLAECIDSTFVSYVGQFVTQFEQITAGFTGAGHAIAVSNGTSALQIALMVSGVSPGEEVITQPLTFVATANAIAHCGAKPVFVDIDRSTLGMSPTSLAGFLESFAEIRDGGCYNKTTGARISACVPVHIFGHPCKIDEIVTICEGYKIPVVEDAAESLGSFYKNRHTGTFGKVGVLSYNGNKTVTTGGGGMILTNEKPLADLARHLTTTGKVSHPWEYIHDTVAFNYRMPNVNAAIGLAQMETIGELLAGKRKTAERYREFFDNIDGIDFIAEPENSSSNYWLNAIVLPGVEERDSFLARTNRDGVMTRPVWRLMNRLDMYRHCQATSLINAEWLAGRIVNIPSSYLSK